MVDPHSNTEPAEDQRLRVAALTALQDYVSRELAEARRELHKAMANGDSHTVWSPLDPSEQIATVNRSKPGRAAVITDRAALEAWLAEHQPEAVEVVEEISGDALEYLRDAAPELLIRRRRVAEWAVTAVVRASTEAKRPVHPDGTVDVPGVDVPPAKAGTLSVRLSNDAGPLVAELIAQGVLDQHGRRLAIEAS